MADDAGGGEGAIYLNTNYNDSIKFSFLHFAPREASVFDKMNA